MIDKATGVPVIEVRGLRVEFGRSGGGRVRRREPFVAVDDVSFAVTRGTTYGIVGESGSGKSTTIRAILGLVPATGQILIDGISVFDSRQSFRREIRQRVQMVFQDPFTSLNPRRSVMNILAESMRISGERSKERIVGRIHTIADRVGIDRGSLGKYPSAFSGGQRQRIGIARALLTDPEVLLLDEPTSALDVSVQAQVLNLLKELQDDLGLTYVFISHDLPVIRYMCDTVSVMKSGAFVETGDAVAIFSYPSHPFTRRLVESIDGDGLNERQSADG